MVKHSINLLLKPDEEKPLAKKLKIIMPIAAVVILGLFVVSFFFVLVYTNSNINQFNTLKREIGTVEQRIANNKNTEGIYTLTSSLLTAISQIVASKKSFTPLMEEIVDLEAEGIDIIGARADQKGNVELTITASSSAFLTNFVNKIVQKEEKKLLSDIKASGIVRNKKGQYSLNVSFKADQTLLQ